jgi:peptidoglycan biosynthesis protein MviN/MurJ (putative lipid II flippase)
MLTTSYVLFVLGCGLLAYMLIGSLIGYVYAARRDITLGMKPGFAVLPGLSFLGAAVARYLAG